ncbi:MAG: glycosyltransferase family 25 protein [Pirellulales bacterium]
MRVEAFVVHLERATARQPQVAEIARSIPLPTTVLAAVDAQHLEPSARERLVRPRLHAPAYPFRLLDTEIACFLSHRRAWQTILDAGLDAGLIVEDDVAVANPLFRRVLGHAIGRARPEDFIRFPLHERTEGRAPDRAEPSLIEPRLPGLGMQMQLVGHEAARRLLAASEVFDRPVDSYVQMQWIHGARMRSARPVVIREIDFVIGGSTVQNKRAPLAQKAAHELGRPILRLAVRLANERWRRRGAA